MTAGTTRIAVTGASPYDVVVGHDLLGDVAGMLGPEVRQVAVVHPTATLGAVQRLSEELRSSGLVVHALAVPDGEAAKSSDVATTCWAVLGRLGFTRSDAVIGVGGGATTDVAGFVAATFLRGMRVVQVPTTLLAMVDAAIGGKTGINTAEGKNLVGCFHEPAGVVCDLALLRSLPAAELVSGLAEVVKCGLVSDPAILELLTSRGSEALDASSWTLRELVERAIAVKARVVSSDLREATSTGTRVGREALNYGHTLGHAIERVEHYSYRHGEAVAIGLVYAAELARLLGRLDDDEVDLHRHVLDRLGLPTSYPHDHWTALRDAMRVDKKARGDHLRFVVLDGIARPAILEAPDEDVLASAYARIIH